MKRGRPHESLTEEDRLKLLQEKEENEAKRQKLGISKSQYKKLLKQQRHEETKDEYRKIKREKRKQAGRKHRPDRKVAIENQLDSKGVRCLVDCEFDDLMTEKEITSLSNQITRMYSSKRQCKYNLPLIINTFNKRLKERFDNSVPQYKMWKNLVINEETTLAQQRDIDVQEGHEYVYLTPDTDEEIEELKENTTYIIGGIVDKNRHKNLCVNKAKELGMKVGRLPIGKYIKINGRQVLATSHVYEICGKWLEYRDWEKAFNEVLPPRKLIKEDGGKESEGELEPQELETEKEEDKEEENKEKLDEGDV